MASAYLGPETHKPLSVISESFQKRYNIPEFDEHEKFSFGQQYEERMYMLIHKYLDLETVDKLCYVGDNKGSIAYHLQEKFVLLEPVTTVVPGHFHYAETDGHKVLPIRIAHVGAEEYFRQLVKENATGKKTIFDKVILKEVVRYFTNPEQLYVNVLKCLSPTGKLLVIHRAGSLTTLPYFKDAKQRFADNEPPYTNIIKTLQTSKLDVQWELECLPIVMPKKKWFSMMKEKYPPQMDLLSDFEVVTGMRELSEGVLKYSYDDDLIEFDDRLLFITATPSHFEQGTPSVFRFGVNQLLPTPSPRDLRLSMDLTPEIDEILRIKEESIKEAKPRPRR
ncbi:uncharacterized protein LOC121377374 [Gigantopelta aegis]|uniref:uncharacterized protein LOC121377374 n=1 Tax=Gigantopelta aegis TaxID=1735272 RepID=UPI001B88AA5B|nr:uncharacterized protein LOC121377374 [Gigantopelta aegis]